MVNKLEEEITAMQADFAGRMAWLRSNYLPDPLPELVKDCLEKLERHYETLREMLEEQEATAAFQRTRGQETIPDEIVGRLLAGESPIRVWREYRNSSLRALAAQVGMSPSVLSEMETGKSEGRPGILRKIARVLNVSTDELMPSDGETIPTSPQERVVAQQEFRVVAPRGEDDPVRIEGKVGSVRVSGVIPVVAMQDFRDNGITPAQRAQYARDQLPILKRLIEDRYRSSGSRRVDLTFEDLRTIAAQSEHASP